jgi:hypothetical protein
MMRFNRITGILLALVGLLGYFTVADDLRHVGEFVGVTSILIAGFVLLIGGVKNSLLSKILVRFIASGILLGIPLGAFLDKMIFGVSLGCICGLFVGILIVKLRRIKEVNAA